MVAEVFLAVWRRLDEVPSEPSAWLLGIARGVLSNRRRGQDRHAALIARLISDQQADAATGEAEVDVEIVTALGSLSASDQELLLLVAWEELSVDELARVLGVRRGTAAVRLHRARRRLRHALSVSRRQTSSARGHSTEMEVL